MFVSISEAALILGVSASTLRRWEREGLFHADLRTPGGHRRYSATGIRQCFIEDGNPQEAGLVVAYARVSSHDQKSDLERQITRLEDYCHRQFDAHLLISDLGSGLNYKKRGLNKLLRLLLSGKLREIVLTHKDRLQRFGSELIFRICEYTGTKVRVIDEQTPLTDKERLAHDVLEIMTVFSARLYGKRSHAKRQMEALR